MRNRLRVLIVDDNEMMRSVLRLTIQSDAYEVVGDASCCRTGMEQINRLRPDVAILDVHMPNGNGLDMFKEIKEIFPQMVVLMVTASSERETVQTAMQEGADGFIIKPFKSGTVLDVLEKSKKKLRAAACT